MIQPIQASPAKGRTIQSLLAASAIGLGVAAVLIQIDKGNPVDAAQNEVEPESLSFTTYSHVEQLRRSGSLSDEDLAALEMDEAEAIAVLGRLVDWCKANERALSEAQQSVARATNELREHNRLARIGEATQSELSSGREKIENLTEARKSQRELVDAGSVYAMRGAPGKTSAWAQAKELNGKASLEMRYVPGIDELRIKSLNDEAKRQGVFLEKVLSRSEKDALAAVRQRISSRLSAIRSAEATALPMPEELKQDTEDLVFTDLLLE